MTPIHLDSIVFSDGTRLDIDQSSIVVLVGPNNSGKSRALRDIHLDVLNHGVEELAAVTETALAKRLDDTEFSSWLEAHAHRFRPPGRGEQVVRPNAEEQPMDEVLRMWQEGPPFRRLTPFLLLTASTNGRLDLAGSAGAFDVLEARPTTALHELFLDGELEQELSAAVLRAFGVPITVNRAAGANIHLHLGEVTADVGPRTPTNPDYVKALRELPLVQNEGDGVRSYIGLLLSVIASRFPLILIDEPEAFLHPPQARQLGREMARLLPSEESQIILATHSADFVQGILDDAAAPVTIVRLTRDQDVNHASVLPADALRELWGDPILRYSGLLNGLFHKGVVLCESDSDCRFYQATLDAALTRESRPTHDLLFSHTGGKDRLPTAISALKAIHVEINVIADIDVLQDEALLKRIVESLGSSWDLFQGDWRMVHAEVAVMRAAPTVHAVKEEIEELAEGLAGDRLTREQAARIRAIAKFDSGWSLVKRGGTGALPQGQATVAVNRLLASLKEIGLLVVPVGELERWAPEIPSHGPKWTSAALEAGVHEREGAAANFVLQMVS